MNDTFAFYIEALRRDFADFCGGKLQELGLSRGQLYFLLYVGKHPDCGPGELSVALGADTGHTARSVEKLVQAGLVSRRKDEADRRAWRLTLTELGREAFQEAHSLFYQWDRKVLGALSQEDQEQGKVILGALLSSRRGQQNGEQSDV